MSMLREPMCASKNNKRLGCPAPSRGGGRCIKLLILGLKYVDHRLDLAHLNITRYKIAESYKKRFSCTTTRRNHAYAYFSTSLRKGISALDTEAHVARSYIAATNEAECVYCALFPELRWKAECPGKITTPEELAVHRNLIVRIHSCSAGSSAMLCMKFPTNYDNQ